MSGRVVVVLTDAQRRALRSLADVTLDAGEGGRALAGALEALDRAMPAVTAAEYAGLCTASALLSAHADDDPETWGRSAAAADRVVSRVSRLRGRS